MSQTEHHIGYLVEEKPKLSAHKHYQEVESFQNLLLRILNKEVPKLGYVIDDNLMSIRRAFEDELYQKYIILDDRVYKVVDTAFDEDDDMFLATKDDDGVIRYQLKYYNGGCSFEEALEEAMKKLK